METVQLVKREISVEQEKWTAHLKSSSNKILQQFYFINKIYILFSRTISQTLCPVPLVAMRCQFCWACTQDTARSTKIPTIIYWRATVRCQQDIDITQPLWSVLLTSSLFTIWHIFSYNNFVLQACCSRYGCENLVSREKNEFLAVDGDPAWLEGLHRQFK